MSPFTCHQCLSAVPFSVQWASLCLFANFLICPGVAPCILVQPSKSDTFGPIWQHTSHTCCALRGRPGQGANRPYASSLSRNNVTVHCRSGAFSAFSDKETLFISFSDSIQIQTQIPTFLQVQMRVCSVAKYRKWGHISWWRSSARSGSAACMVWG